MREKYWWLTDESKQMLERGYLLPNQTVDEKLNSICKYAASFYKDEEGLKEKFLELFERGWCSLSSPIWANFGEDRGLPISCFNTYIPDSMDGIYGALHEVAMETKLGGGTSGYFKLRSIGSPIKGGGISSGLMSFVELFDTTTKVVSQAGVRRGAFAAYVDIEHPEIEKFLTVKDKQSSLQSINTGICVSDEWMKLMEDGDKEKREIWAKILKSRREKGIPYLFFSDTVNKNKPQIYKDTNSIINASNLCNEIYLPTSETESFVCCLLSMNLFTYDEWENTDAVKLAVMFLDAVMSDFIKKVKDIPSMYKTYNFAKRHRALGLGVMGWHSLLQQKMIPFESFEAQQLNTSIFKYLKENSYKASIEIGDKYGHAPIFDEVETSDIKRRNTTLLALAPTTSSSSILGQVSQSVEPYASNYFVAGLAKGSFTRKNLQLENLLINKNKNTEDVWKSIIQNQGSVQHLDFLTDREKEVFKTFQEISPFTIIQQASARQYFIDQGQSINLKIPNAMSIRDVNKVHMEAWKLGLKGLYYQRGTSVAKEAVLSMMECKSCEA
ncbi:MAG: ribonucleoside-diphosphate reductase subunit alpha [Leptotrichiaceae bacterium]|nr:ribonucleoside-diphosphate reductase subunit alpha [Leptotrichiaceae bacterium]